MSGAVPRQAYAAVDDSESAVGQESLADQRVPGEVPPQAGQASDFGGAADGRRSRKMPAPAIKATATAM